MGTSGTALLWISLVICLLGFGFGIRSYAMLRSLPVHKSMLEISELIYETCKAYLFKQGRFLMILWIFITTVIVIYYKFLTHFTWGRTLIIVFFSLLGMAGSYAVAWFGIRVNTFANSRMAFASVRGKPLPLHKIPMQAGMSIGMVLISLELFMMLIILLILPPAIGGACFIGFAIGESLGASALRIAGGIFTKIADIGSDLMKIVFKIDEDDPRNPGVIADCVGDNAGDSVGPSADGFETYGVTGVALVTFIILAVEDPQMQATLLVWIFVVRAAMLVAFSAMAATAFLGGWLGPWLPGPLWLALKTLAVMAVLLWLGHSLARVSPERCVTLAWLLFLPLSFVDLIWAGLEAMR